MGFSIALLLLAMFLSAAVLVGIGSFVAGISDIDFFFTTLFSPIGAVLIMPAWYTLDGLAIAAVGK